jgi:TPR repeat protein
LAELHATGVGVPKNEIEALAWCYIAAEGGDNEAAKLRGILEERLSGSLASSARHRSEALRKLIKPPAASD